LVLLSGTASAHITMTYPRPRTTENKTENLPFTLTEPIPDKVGGRYSQTITLPATPCTNCTSARAA
jgi:hypothetical protein